MKLERLLQRFWYNRHCRFLAWFLLPFSLLYWTLSKCYQWIQKKQRVYFNIPVIVIGNLTTGGTGKTPVLIALTQFLQASAFKVGVVSRGYKSEAEHASAPVLVKGSRRMKMETVVEFLLASPGGFLTPQLL